MGNLEVSNRQRSPFTRKPIFSQQSSFYNASRSLSPFLLRTSRSNIYKSTITKHSNRPPQRSAVANRIYLSPTMVKSVIKDSTGLDYGASNVRTNARLNRSMVGVGGQPSRGWTRAPKEFARPRREYQEQAFQETSPNKDRRENRMERSRNQQSESIQKQNIGQRRFWIKDADHMEPIRDFTISPINKSSNSGAKGLPSGHSSSRNYGIDAHFPPQVHQCCCHHQVCSERNPIDDNAPTERKKHPFLQIPKPEPNFKFQPAIKTGNSTNLHYENRQKCREIIKRVRNFNQFLNQIKNKIRSQYSNLNSSANTIGNVSMSDQDQKSFNSPTISVDPPRHQNSIGTQLADSKVHQKSITLALRLENERIELEKYRKLVERELSKQHSIESIEIEQKNKEKLITINFDNEKASHKSTITKNTVKKQQLKNQFKKTKVSKLDITKIKQKQEEEPEMEPNDDIKIKNRVSKINTLFNKMEGMSKMQIESHREVFEMLRSQDEGDQL